MDTPATIARAISNSSIPTALFLGAGASIQSGAPSGTALSDMLRNNFFPEDKDRSLSDVAERVELKFGRKILIEFLRKLLLPLKPSPILLQLPRFNFVNIYTTNYDCLIEKSFENSQVTLPVVRSNKDYAFDYRQYNTMLFKLHGCITEDRAEGLAHGMILTDQDYSTYEQYRQIGFRSFEQALSTCNVIFVGYSMSDSNIK